MRKNVKKQLALRVLSTAALMAMVSSIATAAFAGTYDLNKGSVTVETRDDGYTYVTQVNNNGSNGQPDTTGVTITSNGTQTSNTITVETADKQTTNVTLENVHIESSSAWSSDPAPIEIKGNGNTNLELNGNNIVLSGNPEHAAIEKADKYGHGTLTIKDDVNDDGKLLAGGFSDGAGIGGGGADDTACTSNITITGGDITARGGYHESAGIGGGSDGTGTNIRIEGNAHVTATGVGGAAIGGGVGCGNDVTIAGNAVVNAYSEYGAGIGDGCSNPLDRNSTTNITITDNAKVHAEAKNGAAAIGSSEDGSWNQKITIEKNANVTAVGSNTGVAIGTCFANGTTSIQITGGTVNAINSYYSASHYVNSNPAIGGKTSLDGPGSIDITVNSSTGDTVVNAYTIAGKYPPAIGLVKFGTKYGTSEYILSDGADYNKDGSSKLGETHSAVINYYKDASVTKEKLDLPDTLDSLAEIYDEWDDHCEITGGTLTKVVHNRKYMEKNPDIDTSKLENSDLHDWQLVDKVAPTLEKDGYADYVCNIDECGQTRHVVLPKLTPEESGSVETREVGVIFWDAAAQAAPAALQGKVLSADEQTAMAAKAQVESLLADKANWKLAEDVGDLMIHPAADAAGTVYEQAVKASGCQYYVIANVTAQ